MGWDETGPEGVCGAKSRGSRKVEGGEMLRKMEMSVGKMAMFTFFHHQKWDVYGINHQK